MKELRLPLMSKWFEMTKAGIKTEDYREISSYWDKRLFTKESMEHIRECFDNYGGCMHIELLDFKAFDKNIITLGYPKNSETDRIVRLEHKGIEIRTGNPEWGAVPGKLYFVIKHGKII